MVFVFLFLIYSLSMRISISIHVAANGIISFFLWLSNTRNTSWPPFWHSQPLHPTVLERGASVSKSWWQFPGAGWGRLQPFHHQSLTGIPLNKGWLPTCMPFPFLSQDTVISHLLTLRFHSLQPGIYLSLDTGSKK